MKHFKVTTKAGIERKFNRIVAQSLATSHPEIYALLANTALDKIREDNADVRSHVQTWGIGAVKKASQDLFNAVDYTHEKLNEYAYGDATATPNHKRARLLKKAAA